MFDTNLDSAKFYLKELERQATASHRLREVPSYARAERTSQGKGLDSLIEVCGRLPARVFAYAVRGVVASVF